MKQRILSALVFVPVLLLFMYLGGAPFAGLVVALGAIGVHEFYTMAKTKHQVLFVPVLLGVMVMLIAAYLACQSCRPARLACLKGMAE